MYPDLQKRRTDPGLSIYTMNRTIELAKYPRKLYLELFLRLDGGEQTLVMVVIS